MENVSVMEALDMGSQLKIVDMETIKKSKAFIDAVAEFQSKHTQQEIIEVQVQGHVSPSQGTIACSISPLPLNVQSNSSSYSLSQIGSRQSLSNSMGRKSTVMVPNSANPRANVFNNSMHSVKDMSKSSLQMSESTVTSGIGSSNAGSSMVCGNRLPSSEMENQLQSVQNDLTNMRREFGQMFCMVRDLMKEQNLLIKGQQEMLNLVMSQRTDQQNGTLKSGACQTVPHSDTLNHKLHSNETANGECATNSVIGVEPFAHDKFQIKAKSQRTQQNDRPTDEPAKHLNVPSSQIATEAISPVKATQMKTNQNVISQSSRIMASDAKECCSQTVEQKLLVHYRQQCALTLYSRRLKVNETPLNFCDSLKRLYRAAWPDRDECLLEQDVFVLYLNGMPTEVIDKLPIPGPVGLDEAVVWTSMAIDKLEEKVGSVGLHKLNSMESLAVSEKVETSDKVGSFAHLETQGLDRLDKIGDCKAHSCNNGNVANAQVQNEGKRKSEAQGRVTSVDRNRFAKNKFGTANSRRNSSALRFSDQLSPQTGYYARVSSPPMYHGSVTNVPMVGRNHWLDRKSSCRGKEWLNSDRVWNHISFVVRSKADTKRVKPLTGEVGVTRIEQAEDLMVEHLGHHVVQYWRTRKKECGNASPADDAQEPGLDDGVLETWV
jgi:hypothetical protein